MNKLADISLFEGLSNSSQTRDMAVFNVYYDEDSSRQIVAKTAKIIQEINQMIKDIKYVGTVEANCASGYKYNEYDFVNDDLIRNIGYVKERTCDLIEDWTDTVRKILEGGGAGSGAVGASSSILALR